MITATQTSPAVSSANDLVVIKLWEVYLLYHPSNLYKTLSEHSVDATAEHDAKLPGRVIFRFTASAWESEIKPLLYEHRIPVSVQSGTWSAVKVKGRMTVLR